MNPLELLSSIGGCFHDISHSSGLVISLFFAGLVGSASHCVLMCGPFVVSQVGKFQKIRDVALIPYHLGRMTTYVFMGILVYSVLNLVFVYSDLKSLIAAPLLMLAGTIFIVSAFPVLGKIFPWAADIKVSLPFKFIQNHFEKLAKHPTVLGRYFLGVLLGFMPCGLVVAALIASATAPTLFGAIASMAAFAVGTVPALVLVAIGGSSIKKKYSNSSLLFSKIAKTVSALWLFALAGTMVL